MGGLVCGKGIQVAARNVETTQSLLTYTALCSAVGATLGVGVAYYRKLPLHIYGISVGANFALLSFTFFGNF